VQKVDDLMSLWVIAVIHSIIMCLFVLMQHKSGLLSSLPPPEHVTNLTSLVPQSLSKAAATMKSKASVLQSARLQKPAVETTSTAKQALSAGFIDSRLLAGVAGSAIEDSDEDDVGAAADFFSLDDEDKPAVMYPPATSRPSETVDVRWTGSTKSATVMPTDHPDVSTATADIVWNAASYSAPATELPPVGGDTAMVCTHCVVRWQCNRCFSTNFVPFSSQLY